MYQLAMVPFGGYVRMAGEGAAPGSTPAHDELGAKSVGARFLVYSGGVIMNVVFALVAFPIAYSFGVPITRPIISAPVAGGGAWEAGIPAGLRAPRSRCRPHPRLRGSPGRRRPERSQLGRRDLQNASGRGPPHRGPAHQGRGARLLSDRGPGSAAPRMGASWCRRGSPAAAAGMEDGARLLAVGGVPQTLTVAEAAGLGDSRASSHSNSPSRGSMAPDPRSCSEPSWEPIPERVLFGIGPLERPSNGFALAGSPRASACARGTASWPSAAGRWWRRFATSAPPS